MRTSTVTTARAMATRPALARALALSTSTLFSCRRKRSRWPLTGEMMRQVAQGGERDGDQEEDAVDGSELSEPGLERERQQEL